MKKQEVLLWQDWTIGILGLWLMLSAFLQFDSKENLCNNMLVGCLVSLVNFSSKKQPEWQSWIYLLIGLWIMMAALTPSLKVDQGYILNNLISGSV